MIRIGVGPEVVVEGAFVDGDEAPDAEGVSVVGCEKCGGAGPICCDDGGPGSHGLDMGSAPTFASGRDGQDVRAAIESFERGLGETR